MSAAQSADAHPAADAAPPLRERFHPMSVSPRGTFTATVRENHVLCTDHYRLVLSIEKFPPSRPGQFVQLDCRDPVADAGNDEPREFEWPSGETPGLPRLELHDRDLCSPLAYLRRPFSIADHRVLPDGSAEIDVIHRVVGRGTSRLKELKTGQQITLLGPLGIGFQTPRDMRLACLVGGGVGIPPMLYLAKTLAAQEGGGFVDAVGFIGAQRADLLPVTVMKDAPAPSATGEPVLNVLEFQAYGYPAVITTDDGSAGMKGYVTQALRKLLETRRAAGGLEGAIVFCCGPTPMMKATSKVAADFGVTCLVSLEQPMACGMGTCQSCIIKYRPRGTPDDQWKYKLTCTDGPVFDTRDILW